MSGEHKVQVYDPFGRGMSFAMLALLVLGFAMGVRDSIVVHGENEVSKVQRAAARDAIIVIRVEVAELRAKVAKLEHQGSAR